MYNLFKKRLKKDLQVYLEEKGFRHYKNETYIYVHNELIFLLSFNKGSHGTNLNMSLSEAVPIVQEFFSSETDLEHCSIEGSDLSNSKWELERYNKSDLETKTKKINEYVADIKYIYTNYISHYISKKINSFDIEEYIEHEYDRLFDDYLDEIGEEDPAWTYQVEFFSSGKRQEEWTKEDDEQCEKLTKAFQNKHFPYQKIKNKILKTIDKNRSIYKELIYKYSAKNTENIDKEVVPVSLKELMNKNTSIRKFLNKFNFIVDTEIDLLGIQNYGETKYYKNNNCNLRIILKNELFLEFIIYYNGESKRVNLYDGGYFWFGWLVGKESTREHNINEALNKLESEIVKQSVKNHNPNTH